MKRLYLSILYLCLNFGEVRSLLDLADSLDMNYGRAWKRLRRLEMLDRRLHVIRRGPGPALRITYDFEGISDRFYLGGITISRAMLYRETYEVSGQSENSQRHLSSLSH